MLSRDTIKNAMCSFLFIFNKPKWVASLADLVGHGLSCTEANISSFVLLIQD
ncbi:hypothetical protein DSUL_60074 [Desulfovibrionales bacterium]